MIKIRHTIKNGWGVYMINQNTQEPVVMCDGFTAEEHAARFAAIYLATWAASFKSGVSEQQLLANMLLGKAKA